MHASAAAAPATHTATAASSSSSSCGPGDLECPTCKCMYTDPLLLTCGHALCSGCVSRWTHQSQQIANETVEHSVQIHGLTDLDINRIWGGVVPSNGVPRPPHPKRVSLTERCALCLGTETSRQDLVFCDRCNVCVHPACYNISRLPAEEESWYCEPCEDVLGIPPQGTAERIKYDAARAGSAIAAANTAGATVAAAPSKQRRRALTRKIPTAVPCSVPYSADTAPRCCVCPNRTDKLFFRVADESSNSQAHSKHSMQKHRQRRYIHVSCATYLEGTEFAPNTPVKGVDNIGPQWYRPACQFCDEPGAVMQCKYAKCIRTYHVPCGLRNGALCSIKVVDGGEEDENDVFHDNVCVVHRKHVRTVAHAHDAKWMEQKRKEKRRRNRSSNTSRSNGHHSGGKVIDMPCPVCRILTPVHLGAPHLGLHSATELAQRAQEYRIEQEAEEAELAEIMAKFPNSRAHDSDSSDDEERQTGRPTPMPPIQRSATAPSRQSVPTELPDSHAAAVLAPFLRTTSRSQRAALNTPSNESMDIAPATPAPVSPLLRANSGVSNSSPTRMRTVPFSPSVGSPSRLPLSPSSLDLLRAPTSAHSRLQSDTHAHERRGELNPRTLISSPNRSVTFSFLSSAARNFCNAAAAVLSPPLTPSKRKQPSDSDAIQTVGVSSTGPASSPSQRRRLNRTDLHPPNGTSRTHATLIESDSNDSQAETSDASPALTKLRMYRAHSEPAHQSRTSSGEGERKDAAAMDTYGIRRTSPPSRNVHGAARSGRSPHFSLEIDGLEIVDMAGSHQTHRQHHQPNTQPSTNRSHHSSVSTAKRIDVMDESHTEDDNKVESYVNSNSNEIDPSNLEVAQAVSLLESYQHFLQQQLKLQQSLRDTSISNITSEVCSRLPALRKALRNYQSIIRSPFSPPIHVMTGANTVVDAIDTTLRQLLAHSSVGTDDVAAASSARRTGRNKTKITQKIDALLTEIIDPLLA
jgi:hypothetical protein